MTQREQRQAEAERAVRRGELREALGLYRALLAEAPDEVLRARIATIESLLQPDELAGRATPAPPAPTLSRPTTLEQAAEQRFEQGDIPGALSIYQRILSDRPDHELARERLAELQILAPNVAVQVPPRPAAQAPAQPQDPPALLEALLARIAERRKG